MEHPPEYFSRWLRETAEVSIVDLNLKDWQDRIFRHLIPPFWKNDSGGAPFLRILQIAKDELGARTAVIEPYISTDWNEEYGAMYSRVFQPPLQRASRIHFFAAKPSGVALKAADLFDIPEKVRSGYLGYTVVRPLPAYRVGDTVLKSPCCISHSDGNGSQQFHLSHCGASFTTSLLGNQLTVKGMPFIQQETNVGVCAEADLWMVARYLNKMSETVRHRPAEITEMATRAYSVGLPRDGLTDSQIFNAFGAMGLKAQLFYPENPAAALDFLYTCVESSIPVIASLPGHVVVVIGHDYQSAMKFPKRETGAGAAKTRSMSEFVKNFYVHDDAQGPYLPMRVGTTPYSGSDYPGREMLTLDGQILETCIVPLPERLHLNSDDILDLIDPLLSHINDYVCAEMPHIPKKYLWRPWPKNGLIRRVYLRRSSEFKRDLLRGCGQKRNAEIIAQYRCMQMPKYVWLVELAEYKDLGGNPYSRRIRGEIVFDSTANRNAIVNSLLSFHYDGRLYVKGCGERESLFVSVDQAAPYQPLLRAAKQ